MGRFISPRIVVDRQLLKQVDPFQDIRTHRFNLQVNMFHLRILLAQRINFRNHIL